MLLRVLKIAILNMEIKMLDKKTMLVVLHCSEIIIVVIIVGVLASLALPKFFSTVEFSRAQEALSSLATVRGGLERYYVSKGILTSVLQHPTLIPAIIKVSPTRILLLTQELLLQMVIPLPPPVIPLMAGQAAIEL